MMIEKKKFFSFHPLGCIGGQAVREMAFLFKLSLFDVLFFLMPQGIFSGFSGFHISSKINTVSQV